MAGQAQSWREAQRLERLTSRFLLPVLDADVVAESDIRYLTMPVVSMGHLEEAAAGSGLPTHDADRRIQQALVSLEKIEECLVAT